MLEKWVAPLLTRLLSDYVREDCFSSDKVEVAVWSGTPPARAAQRPPRTPE